MTRTYDVVVIGGGTFGLFASLTLAAKGKSVVLIDRGPIWTEASAVNAGSLAVQNKLAALVPYTLHALEKWRTLHTLLGAPVGLHRTGGYKVALSEEEAHRLDVAALEQAGKGLNVRRLDQKALREEAPWISQDVVAATHCAHDSFVSPTRVGPLLRRAVEGAGVCIVENAEVTAIQTRTLCVETMTGRFYGRSIAIAAGAWSSNIAAMAGNVLPISLDVNMASVTEPAAVTIPQIVTHARGILTLKQVANGTCLIGGGWQGIGTLLDRRKGVDYDQFIHNLRLAQRVIPGLAKLNILRSWAGYEGVTPDSLPYLGRLPGHSDIYVAACARGGFTLGPLMGQLLGELIATGTTSDPIDIFDPGRFAHA